MGMCFGGGRLSTRALVEIDLFVPLVLGLVQSGMASHRRFRTNARRRGKDTLSERGEEKRRHDESFVPTGG